MDMFHILGPREVAYLDRTGSGIETVAHLCENGRIVFTFCAFEGPPKIVREKRQGFFLANPPGTVYTQPIIPLLVIFSGVAVYGILDNPPTETVAPRPGTTVRFHAN